MRAGWIVALALLSPLGCQPDAFFEPAAECVVDLPEPGAVVVSDLLCGDARPSGGEGRGTDTLLASAYLRAVIRHPIHGLTIAGTSGGTLIDLANEDGSDLLHEAIPLLGDGWLAVEGMERLPDGVRVYGTITPLPFGPTSRAGEEASVVWRLDPDSPRIWLEGADGLWLNPRGAPRVFDRGMMSGNSALGWEAESLQDLGGVLLLRGVTALIPGTPLEVLQTLSPGEVSVVGDVGRATSLELYDENGLQWSLPVEESVDVLVPGWVTEVRGTASGRESSPAVSADQPLDLDVGDSGELVVDTLEPPSQRVQITSSDGSRTATVLPGARSTLALPVGNWTLTASAGPAWGTYTEQIVVTADSSTTVSLRLGRVLDPRWRLAVTRASADRSPDWRGSDPSSLRGQSRGGVGFSVLAPLFDLPEAPGSSAESTGPIEARAGVTTLGDGWRISSWPHSADARFSGHGSPEPIADPHDALAAHWGGASTSRFTEVDASWLASAGPLLGVWPRPDLVRLEGPQLPDALVEAYDDLLALSVTGPLTWIDVPEGDASAVDLERALLRGQTVASTGPLLEVDVNNRRPGGTVDADELRLSWRLHADVPLDHVAVIGTGGSVLSQVRLYGRTSASDRIQLPESERWVVVTAWSEDESEWAVSAPIWLKAP